MIAHMPIFQVLLPLLAAPLCAMTRRGTLSWILSLVVSWGSFAVAGYLLYRTLGGEVLSYHLGSWAPPWGIEFRVDSVNAFVLLIISGIGALVLPYAQQSILVEIPERLHSLFYTSFCLCLAGLLGVTITGDAFNLFVFLEISSLSTYILVSLGSSWDRRALMASYSYLVMGTLGATFYVIGIGLLYSMTGTLNMADLAERLVGLEDNRTVHVAFGFIVVGIGLKLAMLPLHTWLPNAYSYAPSVVTAFLAATATKAAVYVLLRFIFTIYSVDFPLVPVTMLYVFLPLALVAMFAASTVAIFQVNLKRMLAYSSVAQIGYMLLGISFASTTGLTATILHLFNHALMKSALFLALGAVVFRLGTASIVSVRGLGKQMPWTMAAFAGAGLSLIGVPATVGFISKWVLIQAALEAGWWPVAVLIVASSLLAVIYVWRVIEAAYFHAPPPERTTVSEAPLSMLVPVWMLVFANFYFGIDSELTTSAARLAAETLLGGWK